VLLVLVRYKCDVLVEQIYISRPTQLSFKCCCKVQYSSSSTQLDLHPRLIPGLFLPRPGKSADHHMSDCPRQHHSKDMTGIQASPVS
jgi:hypothetical protein